MVVLFLLLIPPQGTVVADVKCSHILAFTGRVDNAKAELPRGCETDGLGTPGAPALAGSYQAFTERMGSLAIYGAVLAEGPAEGSRRPRKRRQSTCRERPGWRWPGDKRGTVRVADAREAGRYALAPSTILLPSSPPPGQPPTNYASRGGAPYPRPSPTGWRGPAVRRRHFLLQCRSVWLAAGVSSAGLGPRAPSPSGSAPSVAHSNPILPLPQSWATQRCADRSAGSALRPRDEDGATAPMRAAETGSTETPVLVFCCSTGADVTARDRKGETGTVWAFHGWRWRRHGGFTASSAAGADPERNTMDGRTAPMGRPEVLGAGRHPDRSGCGIAQERARVNVRDRSGRRSGCWPSTGGTSVPMLVEHGAHRKLGTP